MKKSKCQRYSKSPKTIEQQIHLLKTRGLRVDDENKLATYLENISYYHLSAYFKSFQKRDTFCNGVSFDEILNIYEFDKKLRLLVLDVTERIEKSFKCRIIYNVSIKTDNAQWFSDADEYTSKAVFDKYIATYLRNARNSQDGDYKNYYKKYTDPSYPPAWIFFEALSFGQTVNFYRNLKSSNKKAVSKTFDIHHKYITSWMYGISIIRNISAHHARLWNKNIFASIYIDHHKYQKLFNQEKSRNVYNYLLVAHILMQKINPTSTWFLKLVGLIKEHNVDVEYMGFPEDWKNRFIEIETIN